MHVIRGLTTSAVYGVDSMLWPLSPIRGICTLIWVHHVVNFFAVSLYLTSLLSPCILSNGTLVNG